MLNLLLFGVKWNLIIVATGDVASREKKKKHTTKKNNKKIQKNKLRLLSFIWFVFSISMCVFFL